MKHNYLKHLFTALLLLCATVVTAHDFEVGGIYYNILPESDKTTGVTYDKNVYNSYIEYTDGVDIIASGTCGSNLTYKYTSANELIIEGTGEMYNYKTDSYAGTYRTAAPWVTYWDEIKKITIKENVTTIGDCAFHYCKAEEIEIPSTVTTIGYSSLVGNNFTSVVIPEGVVTIGVNSFCDCKSLKCVTLPNSLLEISSDAFSYCGGLQTVEFGNSITKIGNGAFNGCHKLEHVTLPNSVKTIESYAFSSCDGLLSLTIPESVTSFGSYAFQGCTGELIMNGNIPDASSTEYGIFRYSNFNKVTIGDNVTSIGKRAFTDNDSIKSLIIGDKVTTIGEEAFYACTNLKNLKIGKEVTSIYDYAFAACAITSLELPENISYISDRAFYCSELTSITCKSENPPYCNGTPFRYVDTIYIPKTSYPDYRNATYWKDFASIKPITNYNNDIASGFLNDSLIWILTDEYELIFDGKGVLEKKGEYPWKEYISLINKITIVDGVTSIGGYAFDGYSGLTSVVIGNSVTSIGSYAFRGCSGLSSIEIPNSVTSIGNYAFYGCSGLTSVVIGNSVTSIGNDAFSFCSGLTSVVIGNSVTSIGNDAFSFCSGLTSITIPNSVTSIGDGAFFSCSGLTSVVIGNSVTSIGNYAFSSCINLKIVYNNSSLNIVVNSSDYGDIAYYALAVITAKDEIKDDFFFTTTNDKHTLVVYLGKNTEVMLPENYNGENYIIGNRAFAYENITRVVIPNSVTSIGDYAFQQCTNLKTVINFSNLTLSKGSSSNGYVALYADKVINAPNGYIDGDFVWYETDNENVLAGYLGNLTELTLPSDYKNENYVIGEKAFYCNTTLTSIEIPNSVTSIGEEAFSSCTGFTSNEIPNSVTSIEYRTFSGCTSLTSIEIPNSVTSIGGSAFSGCSGLTSIEIPNSVTSIGGSAFSGCSGLTSIEIPNSVTSIGERAFNGCSGLTSITIPNSVTSIGGYAFYGCSGLTSIEIPNSVTSIGSSAFSGCSGLKNVHISDIPAWCNISFGNYNDNPLYYAKNLYLNGENVTKLVIPEGVKEIKNYAFNGCTGLTSIEIPNSVTSIGGHAFSGCSGLTSVVIGNSVTSIGNLAFYDCTALKTVINFSNLTLSKGSSSNGHVASYADKVINAPNGYIDGDFVWYETDNENVLAVYLGNLTELTLPSDYKNENYVIGEKAFYCNTTLTSIEIPNSVTSIGSYAFRGCTGLASVEIPNSVTNIGNYAFYGCTGLASVEIPNSVTNIGNYAFYGCTGLTSIEIPNSVTSIGNNAFYGCSGLTSVIIPNNVTSIGYYAFSGCSGLTSITSHIPADKLFKPGSSAFGNVDKNNCTLYVPYGAKETYVATNGWKDFTNIVELEPRETITINQYGCATYCSEYALDFSNVEGLKAYAATGYNKATQVVTLTRVQTTEAGVGLFLKGEPGEYVVPVIEYSNDYTLNLLVGTLEQTTVNSTEGEMSNYKFTIADGDVAPMFYPFENNTTFSAGKAYLQIPTAWLPATAQKSVSIRFDEGETTGIDELEGENGKLKGENGEVKTIYDLQGRVVENPTSGIYIIDGKKTLVK